MEMDDHKRRRNLILYVLIAFAVYLVLSSVLFPNFKNGGLKVKEVAYSQLLKDLENKKVDRSAIPPTTRRRSTPSRARRARRIRRRPCPPMWI